MYPFSLVSKRPQMHWNIVDRIYSIKKIYSLGLINQICFSLPLGDSECATHTNVVQFFRSSNLHELDV